MTRLGRWIDTMGRGFNIVACLAVILMMLLTCADVIMRIFRHPITGTYEMVGYLGIVTVAFSLAYTSIVKGHVAVELLVNKLPMRMQFFIGGIASLFGTGLFSLIAWQCARYGKDLKISGEVSMTLGIPTYPFAYGIALGSAMLCLVLIVEAMRSFRMFMSK
jgi:TRAP-type C4-dicarboxylate transport system permease small subunit